MHHFTVPRSTLAPGPLVRALFSGVRHGKRRHGVFSDSDLKRILTTTRVIACVGVSPNPVRPSYYVARYLRLKGFRVIPVNPGLAGEQLFGETVSADLMSDSGWN